ncbi:MAG: Hsp20/alpha crystallin family protein [Saprospiraceae bacterium]
MTLVKFKTVPTQTFAPQFNSAFGAFNRPAVNVAQTAQGFEIEVAAPGFQREDFHIHLEADVLTISAKKQATDAADASARYSRREFAVASFERAFRLPDNIDPETITASYQQGILRVTLAFKPERKPLTRSVEVA